MVLGGALGNILDRVRHGYVVDFADLHFGDFRPFFIFNVADAAISIGVVILLLRAFLVEGAPQGECRTCVNWSRFWLFRRSRLADAACIGGKPKAPDEFQVARNAPLVIPPDYTLTPPVAGTAALDSGRAPSSRRSTLCSAARLRAARAK